MMTAYRAPDAANHPPFPTPAAKTMTAYGRPDAANHPGSPAIARPRRHRPTSPFRGMPVAVRVFLVLTAIVVAIGIRIMSGIEDKYRASGLDGGPSSATARIAGTPSPSVTPAAPAKPEYANVPLTLPGGGCFVDTVELAATGPQVDPRGLNLGADLAYDFCGLQPPALYAPDLGQATAAVVSGTPDAAACSVIVDRQPMGTLTLAQLTAGTQICVKDSLSKQSALFNITGIDAKTFTLTMTATGWATPGAS